MSLTDGAFLGGTWFNKATKSTATNCAEPPSQPALLGGLRTLYLLLPPSHAAQIHESLEALAKSP
ncbi:hypothetical protein QJS10_CPB04g01156 [Acorus calamus]|uniref:Uncharacterized protein n=1 Tax=Acorus calamus TaxID=4465 RepID=A0AAV9F1X7_ACOCL|nr:hypothetical protein QJS10_CPB04g01156 [Acorus calamus]